MSATYPDATDEQIGVPDLQTTIPQENITPDVMTPEMRAGLFQDSGGALKAALLGNPPPQTGNGLVGPSAMDAFQQAKVAAAEREKPNDMKANLDMLTGKMTVEGMPQAMWQQMLKANQFYEQALGGYAQELARNQQELLQVRGNPLLNVLATVSGQMAQQQNMPGIVQALGRANLELNPTAQRLQQERLGLLNQMTGVAGQQTAHMAQMGNMIEKARANDINQQKANDVIGKSIINRLFTDSIKQGAPPDLEAFTRQMMNDPMAIRGGYADPNVIQTLYDRALSQYNAAQKTKDSDAARKLDLFSEQAEIKKKDALALIDKKFQNSLITAKNAAEYAKALSDHKEAIKEEIRSSNLNKLLRGSEVNDLEQAKATDLYLNRLEDLLSRPEFKKVQGPWFDTQTGEVNMQAIMPAFAKSADRAQLENMLQHETPRILKSVLGLQGGVRIVASKEGQDFLMRLGMGIKQRPDQLAGSLNNIRNLQNETREMIISAHERDKGLDWNNYRNLLGVDDPHNAYYWGPNGMAQEASRRSFGGTMAPTNSPATIPARAYDTQPKPAGAGEPHAGMIPGVSSPNTGARPAMPAGTAGQRAGANTVEVDSMDQLPQGIKDWFAKNPNALVTPPSKSGKVYKRPKD